MNSRTNDSINLRWGLLAAGNIANAFAEGVKHSRSGTLAAVGSRSLDKAKAFADKHAVAAAHGSYEDLLADESVDAVYVSTPHPQHAEWTIKALRAGKHVLCEKPLGVNAAEAMTMFEAAAANGRVLLEAFMYRCSPLTAKIVELVRDGAVGDVQLVDAAFSFRAGDDPQSRLMSNKLAGGGILDVGGYAVSFARLIAGVAVGKPFADPAAVGGAAHSGATGVDEWAVATLKFDNGILAQIRTGVRLDARNGATVYGTAGRIEVAEPWIPMKEGGRATIRVTRGKETEEIIVETDQWLYALEADAFAAAVANDGTAPHPMMSPADSLGNAHALDRWRRAVRLTYDFEKPGGFSKTTLAGEPLRKADDAPMTYGRVRGVDLAVSRLLVGCDNQGTLPQMAAMADDFFARGGNAFDTAHIYYGGHAERALGQWMRSRGVRDACFILGKGAHTPYNFPADVAPELRGSLRRLDTDRVELYCPHRDNEDVPVGEWVDALHEVVEGGLARAVGVSNWSLPRVRAFNDYAKENGKHALSAVSNNLSLARAIDVPWQGCASVHPDAEAWQQWRAYLADAELAHVAWSSQARGYFVPGRDLEEEELKRCWASDDNAERRTRAFALAEQKGVEPVAVAAAWVLGQPFESFAVIGPRTPTETRTSVASLAVTLTPGEMAWLNLEADSPA